MSETIIYKIFSFAMDLEDLIYEHDDHKTEEQEEFSPIILNSCVDAHIYEVLTQVGRAPTTTGSPVGPGRASIKTTLRRPTDRRWGAVCLGR